MASRDFNPHDPPVDPYQRVNGVPDAWADWWELLDEFSDVGRDAHPDRPPGTVPFLSGPSAAPPSGAGAAEDDLGKAA